MPEVVRFHQTGDAEVLKIESEPVGQPGPGEVRINVEALGLNRADLIFRRGLYPEKPILPSGLGYDACGVIDAVGDGVKHLKVGDRVSTFTNFSLHDYTVHRSSALVAARSVTLTPPGLTPEEGAAFWNPFMTAYFGLVETGGLSEGKIVLMTAATSSVGAAAVQVCKLLGATFIGTTRSKEKVPLLRKWGADHVVLTSEEDLTERVKEITGRRGADIIFDSVGGPEFEKFGGMIVQHGRLISFGSLTRQPPVLPMQQAMLKRFSTDVFTVWIYTGNSHFSSVEQPDAVGRAKRFILDNLALGRLKPTVDKIFVGLDQYVAATKYLEANANSGKVVVKI